MAQKKTAIVIGGTSGIGYAIARRLRRGGYDVAVTGVSQAGIDKFSESDGIDAYQLDVSDLASIDQFFQKIHDLDVLVNCAGVNRRKGQEFDPETFEYVVRVNLLGTMRACYAAYPIMKKSGGVIINIASMFSTFGSGSIPAYASSKGAVVALTRSLAIAWANDKIRVNAIAPGFIETKLTQDVLTDTGRVNEVISRTPMRRWGKPEDLSGTAYFLCTDEAAFITGATMTVDGGFSITG
jgi:NAD(P)-dependent dehydrogenase (short-subunit alcohol dehydrogenase family)